MSRNKAASPLTRSQILDGAERSFAQSRCLNSMRVRMVFFYCTNLSSLTLSEGLGSIGAAAFEACYGLTTVRIPRTVAALGSSAFMSCHDLTSIRIDAVVPPEVGLYMYNDTKNGPLYVPAESVDSYKSADGWKEYASRIMPIEF